MKTKISKKFKKGEKYILHDGDSLKFLKTLPDGLADLIITSPPYCMGKEYDKSNEVQYFIDIHKKIFPEIIRVTKEGGNICWQVGYHVHGKDVIPLDFLIFDILKEYKNIHLKNRIVWQYGHGLHSSKRFSGRHEVILWFTKGEGENKIFNLDLVRVPQKYPGKRYYKGKNKGNFSGNPLGKNPSDVWDIPNVKSNHVEKTEHPCQFPVALVQRLVLSLSNKGGCVIDPFMGSGSSGVASLLEGRKFIGIDISKKYCKIAEKRCKETLSGKVKYRFDKAIFSPSPNMAVAKKPSSFK